MRVSGSTDLGDDHLFADFDLQVNTMAVIGTDHHPPGAGAVWSEGQPTLRIGAPILEDQLLTRCINPISLVGGRMPVRIGQADYHRLVVADFMMHAVGLGIADHGERQSQ